MTQTICEAPSSDARPTQGALLRRFPRSRSADPAEFLTNVTASYGSAAVTAVTRPQRGAVYEFRAVTGQGFTLGYIRSGLGVRIIPQDDDGPCYLNLAVSGTVHSTSGNQEALNSNGVAAVLSGGQVQALRPLDPSAETIGIKIDRELIEAELAALLGRHPSEPIRFQLGLDLRTAAGRGISSMAWSLLHEASQPQGGLFDYPAFQLQYIRALAIALLVSHRHNYSEALQDTQAPLRPRSLRRALDYIESHLETALTVTDIAAAAGCSARTLHEYFREHVGTSPMGYLRELRLQRVHRELRRTGRPVTDVAYDYGFTHLGRFSSAYRQRFGELPSQTARGAA